MHTMAVSVMGGALVDPAFLLALENQQRRLRAVIDRVDEVRGRLPSAQGGIWRGPAHSVYSSSVDRLTGEFGTIRARLEASLAATGAALSVAAGQR